ncbi:MAG TPA: septal ring lytic transglycosylase RlpA family protein [Actinomycetota bacterium]|nr:septal ring lytic transglycosylase RlpA family protein [Actinomycetota bacterium]
MTAKTRALVLAATVVGALGAPATAHDRVRKGEAIYYSDEFSGETMACGGKYRPRKMVAAHRKLPCGTTIRVKNRANGRVVVLTVKDRGPYGDKDTIVDVSRRAARKLRFFDEGRAKVRLTVVHD